MPHSSSAPYWLAASRLPGVGLRTLLKCLEKIDDLAQLFTATPEALQAIGCAPRLIEKIKQPDWAWVERELAWATAADHHLLTFNDPAYPALLKQIADPPILLYVQGNTAALSIPQLAIVGARSATSQGIAHAENFAQALAQAGFAITSGFARGIDKASHEGALRAKGITLGVAGTGLGRVYPNDHRSLVDRILTQQGAILSEFSVNTGPHPTFFPRRNRIISGLSLGVLVVEAAVRSGSLVTARHAIEQGREVFAIPGSIHHPLSRGCHHLIREGALLVETVDDIIAPLSHLLSHQLTAIPPSAAPTLVEPTVPSWDTTTKAIFDSIRHEITPMDMIIWRTGLTTGEVYSILLSLELQGWIQSTAGGYRRTRVF